MLKPYSRPGVMTARSCAHLDRVTKKHKHNIHVMNGLEWGNRGQQDFCGDILGCMLDWEQRVTLGGHTHGGLKLHPGYAWAAARQAHKLDSSH